VIPLTIQSLQVSFGQHTALSGVSTQLRAGEVVTLLGPNGSGKSTLLRAALGLTAFTGDVIWFGKPARKWTRRELARLVAYMPQHPVYEPGDRVSDVLRLGRSPHQGLLGIDSEADGAVVAEVAGELELSELLSRRIETLSGGQRQRVFLGRCLAQQPQVLLLDEPATFLDLRHQVELYRLLRDLARKKNIGVLMASHDLNLAAAHADRAIVLKKGTILIDDLTAIAMNEKTLSEAFDLPMRCVQVDDRTFVTVVI
jgi:iron complex transport system ATP-binding protein